MAINIAYGTKSIKSIQRGVTLSSSTASATVTITSVDTAKSFVSFLGISHEQTGATSDSLGQLHATIALTDATTLTIIRLASSLGTYLSWEVIEYA